MTLPPSRTPTPVDPDDPKGLIREAYLIEGIGDAECRSILVDWALSLPVAADPQAALARLLDRREPGAPDHPMTKLLRDGRVSTTSPPARRGGASGRRGAAP